MGLRIADTRASYDLVAEEYARHFFTELDQKPFDRSMLDRLLHEVGGLGPICDLGCGPGQIARYLHLRGARVCGIDLSERMVEQARRLTPEVAFQQGDLLALGEVADDCFGGVAAFYSVIHIGRGEVVQALEEIRRVLRPTGVLLLTFHMGREIIHRDEWWGKAVSVDFIFYERDEMEGYLSTAGYERIEAFERPPYDIPTQDLRCSRQS